MVANISTYISLTKLEGGSIQITKISLDSESFHDDIFFNFYCLNPFFFKGEREKKYMNGCEMLSCLGNTVNTLACLTSMFTTQFITGIGIEPELFA